MTRRPAPFSSASAAAMTSFTRASSSGWPPEKRTLRSNCGTASNWWSSFARGLARSRPARRAPAAPRPARRRSSRNRDRMICPDCSPPTLKPSRAHALRGHSGRQPRCAQASGRSPAGDVRARGWTSPSRRSRRPRASRAAPSWCRSAPSADRRRSTLPVSSATISRSASPSSAMPICAPDATTVSHIACGWVEPTMIVDVLAVGIDTDRDHLRTQFPQRGGRDLIGGAIGAIDDDLQPVQPQVIGKGRFGEMDIAAARILDPPRAADIGGRRQRAARRSSAPRSRAHRRRTACSHRGRTA